MREKVDAGGYKRAESDVQFPARVPTRREGEVPEHDYSQVSTNLNPNPNPNPNPSPNPNPIPNPNP